MDDSVFILSIETSGHHCSVALSTDDRILARRLSGEKLTHNATLAPFVEQVLKETGLTVSELSAIAVSAGPGSYTGLRVGIALAKALCFGADKPFIAVDTLQSLAYHAAQELQKDATYIANVDARRMEVYAAAFDRNGQQLSSTAPMIVEAGVFDNWLALGDVVFCGSGTSKCISMLSSSGIICHPMEPKADYLAPLAYKAYLEGQFEDPASFRPQYIKPPNITTPKKITL